MPISDLVRGFFRGLFFPFDGYQFLRLHPKFRRFLLWPTLLNGLLTAVILVGVALGAWELSALARSFFPPTWWGYLLRCIYYFMLGIGALAVVVGASFLASAFMSSVSQGLLAEKVEREVGTPAEELKGLSTVQEITESALSLRDIIAMGLGLLLLGIVPGVGPPLALVIGWYWNAYTLGLETLDYPWALRGLKRNEKRALAMHYRGETVGVGTIALLVGWIPVFGAWVLGLCVIGSVLWNKQR